MARTSKKTTLARQQDPGAPFLFDEDSLPLREDLVQLVRTEAYRHTGARLLDNEAKALRLVELLLGNWGLKRIAQELKVSVHSVRAAREALVAQGKLAPYKSRVVAKIEDIIEVGLDRYLEGLQNGEVAAAQIPVGVGILSDKRALALGEPTAISVSAAAQLDAKSLSVEALNDWVDSLSVDAPSTVSPAQPAAPQALPAHGATSGATAPASDPAGPACDQALDPAQASPPGRGGSAAPAAPELTTQSPSPNPA
jgi:hypothetical protein